MGINGPSEGQSLQDWVLERSQPGLYGGTGLVPEQADFIKAGYSINLLVNTGFESWSSGTSSAPDGWTLVGAGATVARNTTNVQQGLASVNLTAALNTATALTNSIPISGTQNTWLRGATIAVSVWVRVNTANRAFLRLDDGVGTTDSVFEIVGDSAFRKLTVVRVLDAAATKLQVDCRISSGASITAAFDSVMVAVSETPLDWSPNIRDPFVQPRSTVGSGTQTTTSGTPVDITNLSFANVILDGTQSVLIEMSLEWKSSAAASVNFKLLRDSTVILTQDNFEDTADKIHGAMLSVVDSKPAAGNYTYKGQCVSDGVNTLSITGNRYLSLFVAPSA